MRIAIPITNGRLSSHFGHCERIALFDVDASHAIERSEELTAPPYVPGQLPRWLQDRGVTVVLARGMGSRAQELFMEYGVEMVLGVPDDAPALVVRRYLEGTLPSGESVCEHRSRT
jgi:predicted Fe-Mo cluster-binding NifX family protein